MYYLALIFLVLGNLAFVASCFLEHYSDYSDNIDIMKNAAWVVLFIGIIFYVCMAVSLCLYIDTL